jgi:hypothetical protein
MKVVCRVCRELIPEEEAIKMTEASFKTYEMLLHKMQFQSIWDSDFHRYTQMCEECYYAVYRRKE